MRRKFVCLFKLQFAKFVSFWLIDLLVNVYAAACGFRKWNWVMRNSERAWEEQKTHHEKKNNQFQSNIPYHLVELSVDELCEILGITFKFDSECTHDP